MNCNFPWAHGPFSFYLKQRKVTKRSQRLRGPRKEKRNREVLRSGIGAPPCRNISVAIRVSSDSHLPNILRVFGTSPGPCKESEKKPQLMPGNTSNVSGIWNCRPCDGRNRSLRSLDRARSVIRFFKLPDCDTKPTTEKPRKPRKHAAAPMCDCRQVDNLAVLRQNSIRTGNRAIRWHHSSAVRRTDANMHGSDLRLSNIGEKETIYASIDTDTSRFISFCRAPSIEWRT